MSKFHCEPCNKDFSTLGNLTKHQKEGKAHCKCEPFTGQPTIDQYFKKVEVELVAVAETVAENSASIITLASELAEVKVALEVKLTNVQHIAEIASLRVELEHVREMTEMRIENAVMKAQMQYVNETEGSEASRALNRRKPKNNSQRFLNYFFFRRTVLIQVFCHNLPYSRGEQAARLTCLRRVNTSNNQSLHHAPVARRNSIRIG